MRAPREEGKRHLFEYTLMPTRIDSPFKISELTDITLHPGFDFTQGAQVMKIPASFGYLNPWRFGDKLFNLQSDPHQQHNINNVSYALHFARAMIPVLQQHDAPEELYTRFQLDAPTVEQEQAFQTLWQSDAWLAQRGYRGEHRGVAEALQFVARALAEQGNTDDDLFGCFDPETLLTEASVFTAIDRLFAAEKQAALNYQVRLLLRID